MPSWGLAEEDSSRSGSAPLGPRVRGQRQPATNIPTNTRGSARYAGRGRRGNVEIRGLGNPGVPNPMQAHAHPYPTRFHGGIWTRPEFSLPYVPAPHQVFMPRDFAGLSGVRGVQGLGCGCGCGCKATGDWDTSDGIFRSPLEAGGGVFNAVSGMPDLRQTSAFALGAVIGLAGTLLLLKKKA